MLGNLGDQLNKFCGAHIEPEPEQNYKITQTASEDLLGDITEPVALVGTSYGWVQRIHFADFIGAATDLDVLNFSKNGGAKFGAILDFLNSDTFKDSPPRYVIWEWPNSYVALTEDQLSQLRAALNR
ncbi:alginate O-acetyltransferase AlgX-related protein [Deinococcus marmoris]|uniref:alginate O-acetyltransferase AlgX-related protein n=1 Tax=Deinococcus marmoris TaxID=249408 RepID=UPI00096A589A|nr:hypothetical protein [Deinococcus marmoris]